MACSGARQEAGTARAGGSAKQPHLQKHSASRYPSRCCTLLAGPSETCLWGMNSEQCSWQTLSQDSRVACGTQLSCQTSQLHARMAWCFHLSWNFPLNADGLSVSIQGVLGAAASEGGCDDLCWSIFVAIMSDQL